MRNRLHNIKNPYQGEYKKVLCVCSAGLLRSPTAAVVLSQDPYNYNTRACGIDEDFALIIFDRVLYEWADEIVCMSNEQKEAILYKLNQWEIYTSTPIKVLDIPDNYSYRDENLIELIRSRYDRLG